MKKLILSSALIFCVSIVHAQQWSGNNNTTDEISRTGNVMTSGQLFLNGVNDSQIRLNSLGTYYGKIGNPLSQVWSLGYGDAIAGINPVLSWTAEGRVGIGIISPYNIAKLDVRGGAMHVVNTSTVHPYTFIGRNADPGNDSYFYHFISPNFHILGSNKNGTGSLRKLGFAIGGSDYESDIKLTLDTDGNLGLGVTAPSSTFHIKTVTSMAMRVERENSNVFGFEIGGTTFGLYDYTTLKYQWRTGAGDLYLLESGGNVGIGTTNTHGYKLAIAGKTISEEVVVRLQGNWPDYVFAKEYKLPSLSDLELFILTNKHLPGVPTAEEVKENGLSLGDMNAILLKKVEELTLYLLEQNKSLEGQQKQIDKLMEQNKLLYDYIQTANGR